MQPDITVLIPNYNGAHYILRALKSLSQQTYQNFLIYVVDDGSKDNSVDLVRHSEIVLPHLEIFEYANAGITSNWNRSVDLVKTPFFTLLHFDDEYEPTYLETMRSLILKYPDAALAHCPAITINENSEPVNSPVELYKQNKYFRQQEIYYSPEFEFSKLLTGAYINCPSVFFRKKMVDVIGGFNPAYGQVQDWEYWFRVLFHGYRICATATPVFRYRRHNANASQTNSKSLMRYKEEKQLLEWAHREGVMRNWVHHEKIDYTIIQKTVILDISYDLINKLNHDAQKKLVFLQELPAGYKNSIICDFLKAMILLGPVGGKLLQTMINTAVSLTRFLPFQNT
ncbi:MAG: glycosyltransferase [SAR324 cluster bacterium]|nr:glycosyltransferase [SAR324 cluster bacterium]